MCMYAQLLKTHTKGESDVSRACREILSSLQQTKRPNVIKPCPRKHRALHLSQVTVEMNYWWGHLVISLQPSKRAG